MNGEGPTTNPGLERKPSCMPGGYRELLTVALPLILSTSSASLMHVTDRAFLSWHSADALAAAMPAGVTSFIFLSLLVGTIGYVSTFVAQYDGAGRSDRIGAVVWQGIYLAVLSAMVMAVLSLATEPIFRLVGHPANVQREEIRSFRILAAGGGGTVLAAALSAFYSGRGRTWPVMCVEMSGVLLNAVLAYCWIFGKLGFPAWGIAGASGATVAAKWFECVLYAVLIFRPCYRREFGMLAGWRPDWALIRRVLRFGVPAGVHWMVDVMAFGFFVLFIGRLGAAELAASTVAFTINSLIFVPMLGLGMATSTLVGRHLGAGRPDASAGAARSSMVLAALYMGLFSLVVIARPYWFLWAFGPREGTSEEFRRIAEVGRHLLFFVAAYSFIDGANVVYAAALKGAGDTRYVLWMFIAVATAVLLLPLCVARVVFDAGLYAAWTIFTVFVVILAAAYYLRFRTGRWRSMRVIEHVPAPAAAIADGPIVEG